jgi:hypothetical protein
MRRASPAARCRARRGAAMPGSTLDVVPEPPRIDPHAAQVRAENSHEQGNELSKDLLRQSQPLHERGLGGRVGQVSHKCPHRHGLGPVVMHPFALKVDEDPCLLIGGPRSARRSSSLPGHE